MSLLSFRAVWAWNWYGCSAKILVVDVSRYGIDAPISTAEKLKDLPPASCVVNMEPPTMWVHMQTCACASLAM